MITRLKLWAAGIGLVIAALATSWLGGRKSGKADGKLRSAEDKAEQIRRVADADVGIGASDAERIKRLRTFADKHKR